MSQKDSPQGAVTAVVGVGGSGPLGPLASAAPTGYPTIRPSVCLSVHLSVRHVRNGFTYRHTFFSIRQPNHSSFPVLNIFEKFGRPLWER